MKKLNINKYKEIFQNDIKSNQPSETFNRLRDLQKLIKKESALKELCNYINILYNVKYYSYQSKRRHKKTNR
jgi:hypothetical protein